MALKLKNPIALAGFGTALGVLTAYTYFIGFNAGLTFLWVGILSTSLVVLWRYRMPLKEDMSCLDANDIEMLLLVIVLLAPLYFLFNYDFPTPVNSDEIHIMRAEKEFLTRKDLHLLNVSTYFGFPTFSFVTYGALGQCLGGITLGNMRTVSGFVGILIAVGGYFLFRGFGSHLYALGGALVLGLNHVLLAFGRMALRDTSALLTGVWALGFLVRAWVRQCVYMAFTGGVWLGLGYYTNFPGRILAPLWFLYLMGSWFWPDPGNRRKIISLLAVWSFLGFAITVSPIVVDSLRKGGATTKYAREQLMLFPEGRKLQQQWFSDRDMNSAWWRNIRDGLLLLNKKNHDAGWMYPDGKGDYAYVDLISGILVWVGLFGVLWRIRNSGEWHPQRWMVFGFLALLLTYAFIINKAPNYTRLTMILPFVAFFVMEALRVNRWILQLGVALIALANLSIFMKVMERNNRQGNPLGAVVRFVDRFPRPAWHMYYVAADSARYPLPNTGYTHQAWVGWIRFFARDSRVEWLDPERLQETRLQSPGTVFMGEPLWNDTRAYWLTQYPRHRVRSLGESKNTLAVELQ